MKKPKRFLAVLLALSTALSLTACGGSGSGGTQSQAQGSGGEPQGQTQGGEVGDIDHDRQIVYGSASMIVNFNMKYITAGNDIAAGDQVYDTLIRKINGEIVGYLAESWEISEDGLDYTCLLYTSRCV